MAGGIGSTPHKFSNSSCVGVHIDWSIRVSQATGSVMTAIGVEDRQYHGQHSRSMVVSAHWLHE